MNKILVIGCPGSGKSVFSKKLHNITGIPLFHLDLMFWNKDKTCVGRSDFLERLTRVLEADEWIIDGNYASTMELRFIECDTVFFLDYPLHVCLEGINERMGKARSDMPWIETEHDEEFEQFIKNYKTQSRPQVMALLEKYKDKRAFIFKSRAEANDFLLKISL